MPSYRKSAVTLALLSSVFGAQAAFAPQTSVTSSAAISSALKSPTALNGIDSPSTPPEDIAPDFFQKYGEGSRFYRRTVYTHDDWVKHRSADRFFRQIGNFASSGVYKSLFKEVTAVTTVASFVVVWNMIFGDYTDLEGVKHAGIMKDSFIPALSLPLVPFTLSSPSLGLLLVFRTNTSYKRWDEARKNWGMNINHTRDLVRLGTAYYDRASVPPERAEEDLKRLADNTWAFVRSMKRHLSPEWEDEEAFKKELKEKLPADQAERIINAAHRPNRALQDLSTSIENLPMHFMRRGEIHAAATIFEDNLGSSERLLTSPIPVFYSRHTARFLSIWLLMLPFALWGPLGNSWNHINLIPVMTILSLFLFGIEELATQLEEPFTILPMQGFCDKIYNWCQEIVSFKPGDNGMPVYYYDNYAVDVNENSAKGVKAQPVAGSGAAAVGATVAASAAVTENIVLEPEEHVNGDAEKPKRGFFRRAVASSEPEGPKTSPQAAAEEQVINGDASKKRYVVARRAIGISRD
ncbi:hypothetical protein CTEN210_12702 [Chaetoceros tenuissimus]|uniref:Uncharacterized protein n=1 Tax=Chaetoceros tenuissimus TaxID=426638 RepID=A0AAD3D3S5_9STRA|nr:hypothetical protein CTEN210_12702 [Chaetoceros tenuissimus]